MECNESRSRITGDDAQVVEIGDQTENRNEAYWKLYYKKNGKSNTLS